MRLLFLERDIDKALRRMTLEEEKNLTETVNEILWKGLKDYLTVNEQILKIAQKSFKLSNSVFHPILFVKHNF